MFRIEKLSNAQVQWARQAVGRELATADELSTIWDGGQQALEAELAASEPPEPEPELEPAPPPPDAVQLLSMVAREIGGAVSFLPGQQLEGTYTIGWCKISVCNMFQSKNSHLVHHSWLIRIVPIMCSGQAPRLRW